MVKITTILALAGDIYTTEYITITNGATSIDVEEAVAFSLFFRVGMSPNPMCGHSVESCKQTALY